MKNGVGVFDYEVRRSWAGVARDLTLASARGDDRTLQPIAIKAGSHWVPAEITGQAVNVAQVYARFTRDLRDGSHTAPSFASAGDNRRLLDADRAAATGSRTAL